jgi:tetratricopeptide (TPR) repeat protein
VEIAYSMHNIAELYFARSRYAKAKGLYKQSMRMLEIVLGEDHIKVAVPMAGLAKVHYKLGEYQQGTYPPLLSIVCCVLVR